MLDRIGLVCSLVVLDVIDLVSPMFVEDDLNDADNIESSLFEAFIVKGCMTDTVIMELEGVCIVDSVDKTNGSWEGAVFDAVAGDS